MVEVRMKFVDEDAWDGAVLAYLPAEYAFAFADRVAQSYYFKGQGSTDSRTSVQSVVEDNGEWYVEINVE